MKILKHTHLLLIAIFILLIFGCKTKQEVEVNKKKYPKQEIMSSGNHPFKVTEIIEDSRCPKDVKCIWQGKLIVKLGVFLNEEMIDEREVNLMDIKNEDIEWVNKFLVTSHEKYVYSLLNASNVRENVNSNIDMINYKVNIIIQEK